jgi:hypothetical protein
MEVTVMVTVSIDYDDNEREPGISDREALRQSAREAIERAVQHAEANGFAHRLALSASIGVITVELD